MKIAHIINSLDIGGAEKLIMDSVPFFQKKGVNVDVITLNDKKTAFTKELRKNSNGKLIHLSSGSVYNPLLVFKLIPYLKKYDIINVHLFPSLYWIVIAKIISFSRVKIVYTEHNTSNRRRSKKLFRILDRVIYSRLYKIITIADEVDNNIKKHLGFSNDRFKLINNGVDVKSYTNAIPYKKDLFFDSSDNILIQISSFREQKDQLTLINSLQHLPNDVKLLLVGDGHLRPSCEQLVVDNNLQHRVKFLGNRNDVPRLLNTADIVILSSHHEGLSLSNIEGMSVNKPFIGSNVQGIREIVNGYGILFEQGNEKELADEIMKLLNDKDYYKEVADKCYERAQQFDINRMVDKYIKLYESIEND